ncbi:MAG: GNAT family N-acetyltransferase [Coprococcus sp.]
MRVETERMYLYPLSNEEMRLVIEKESDLEMKQAYTEMLEGSLSNPDKRIWYAIWNMELKNDLETIVGDFCFKGLGDDGVVEIGYGLKEEYRHYGYMTEALKAITEWALSQESVKQVEAETDAENIASQKVLLQSGFISNGKMGEEGPRFVVSLKR